MISCRYNEAPEWQAGLRRFQKALGIAPVRCHDDPAPTRPPRSSRLPPGLLPDGSVGLRTWAAALKTPTTGAPVSDEKYLRDIKTQLTGSPDLDKYTWLEATR